MTRPTTKRQAPEAALQTQVSRFLDVALDGNSWWTAIPLGGGGRLRGQQLKRTGTKAGIPDILIINDGRAIWIELKAAHGTVSDVQLYCHAQIRHSRCPVTVCKTLDSVILALQSAGVPLNARLIEAGFRSAMIEEDGYPGSLVPRKAGT